MNSQVLTTVLSKVKVAIVLSILVGAATYFIIGQGTEAASSDCFKTSTANAKISIEGRKATGHFTIPKKCVPKTVTIVSYKAPNGTHGKPYSAQTVYKHTTKTYQKPGNHVISVQLPDCFFQVDLVRGDKVIQRFAKNNTYTEQGRMITARHGGDQSCEPKKSAPAPSQPAAPAAPASVTVVNENNNVNTNENNVVVNTPEPAPAKPAVVQKPAEEPAQQKGVDSLPNTGPADALAAFSFTFTFMGSMLYSYRTRFADMVSSIISRL